MKSAFPWILTAGGAFIAFILFLNLREKDYYDGGSLTPVPGDPSQDPVFPTLFPSEIKHDCPTCGECVHTMEVLVNRRTLTLRDHDGWYKLFWAGDDTYYFDELQHLAASYENRTAMDPKGSWFIEVQASPAIHGKTPAHECSAIRPELLFYYELATSPEPFKTSDGVQSAIVYRYDGDKLGPTLHFGWRLTSTVHRVPMPCPCGRP